MVYRQTLEIMGQASAGIVDETEDYYWVTVLGKFGMYVMKNDLSVTPCLVESGYWEAWVTKYVIDSIKPGTVFFDVGANAGYYSFLANHYGATVRAYEPNPAYYEMLLASIKRQGGGRMPINISPRAVSDRVGKETLYIPRQLHGSASFNELDAKWETRAVEVNTTFLHLSGTEHYIIKIDAEGAEEKIWDGMIHSLRKRLGTTQVLLEYTPGAYSPDFIDKLESYAPLHWINHDGEAEPVDRGWLESQSDWVMLVLKEVR